MVITATERTQIMYLVVGMFNAAPGATYLAEMSNSVQNGASIGVDLAEGLANSTQFKALYPDFQTSNEFATAFANNLLGNTVTDAAKAEAVTAIQAGLDGGQSKASVMVSTILNLFAVGVTDAKWGNALIAFNNKVDVAEWFSVEKAVSTEKVSDLQTILATVTEDPATATAAKDDKNLPGTTGTFTTNLDKLEGSSGSDQFSGVIDATGTLQVGDSLDAGGSYDTLNIVAISGGLDTTLTNITNVEEVTITESSTTDKTHNLSTITGLQKLSLNSLGATGKTTTIGGVATSVDLTMTGQAGGNVVINYSDAAVTGDQTAKLLVKSSVGGDITAAGIEIVELTTEGTATSALNNLTFADAKSISVTGTTNVTGAITTTVADATLILSGSGKIVLGALDVDIDTVTATANTGGVELTLDADKNTQVSLGTGDDKVTTAAAYAAIATDTALIAAGEGTDTLTVTDSTHLSTAGHFTGFENLVLVDGVTVDMDNITGITALEITDGAGATGITNLNATTAANITLRGANGLVGLEVKGATTLNQVDTVKITVDDNLTATNTVTATLKTTGAEVLELVAIDNANITLSAANNASLNTVTLSGAAAVTIATTDLATTTLSINGAAVTGALVIDGTGFAGTTSTITGSDGGDTLTGGASIDTITGGLGTDTITGGAGADVIILTETTAAIDTVVLTGSASSTITTDISNTITDFGTTDILDLTTNASFLHGGAALTAYAEGALGNIGNTVGLQTFTNNITVANATTGPTEAEIETYLGATEVFFTAGANASVYIAADDGVNTYIFQANNNGANKVFTAAEDDGALLVTLIGVADASTLSAANFADFT